MPIPIVIAEFGDTTLEYPSDPPLKYGDEVRLHTCFGIHAICCGRVGISMTSTSHSAITCRSCGLRVVVPNGVKTWGDLRAHFQKFNNPASTF